MIKENNYFTDVVTEKIYQIINQHNLGNATPLFPMLRKENDKLMLGTLIEVSNKELHKKNKVVRPKYWIIIDNIDYSLIELNMTEEKDYMDSNLIPINKEFDDIFNEEIRKVEQYSINKNAQYKDYLFNDIKNEMIINNKMLEEINNTLIVDNEKVNATDYLLENVEEELNNQVNELVDLITVTKYSSIIYYYQSLIEEILDEYKTINNINVEKMRLASQIIETYYGEYCGIKYFFNVK